MYESLFHSLDYRAGLRDPQASDPALRHQGDMRRLLPVHRLHAAAYAHGMDVRPIGPTLMPRLRDTRTIKAAIESLARSGDKAPGPGGLRLETLSDSEQWNLARAISDQIKAGIYRPGPVQITKIPKDGKPGQFRKLTIQSNIDRAVAKAAALIIGPVVEPTFSRYSFGFRPEVDRQDALAEFLTLARTERRWHIVSADIANAFDNVPAPRVLDACRQHLPDDVVDFLHHLVAGKTGRGLLQGSPLSPLLFNIFADWFIDRPWRRRWAGCPLFRYADDLLVACGSDEEAAAAYADLARLTRSAGTPLKGTSDDGIIDLATGQELHWLGYRLKRDGDSLAIRIGDAAWAHLGFSLTESHLHDAAPRHAIQVVRGWVDQVGPCYVDEDRDAVLEKVRIMAAKEAFDEIPARRELHGRWLAAHARWRRVQNRHAQALAAAGAVEGGDAGGA